MTARELLQYLINCLDRDAELSAQEITKILRGCEKEANARILIPVEGKIKMLEVHVRNLGIHHGLTGQEPA